MANNFYKCKSYPNIDFFKVSQHSLNIITQLKNLTRDNLFNLIHKKRINKDKQH